MPIYHAEPTIIESLSDQEIVVAGPLNELHFVAEKIDADARSPGACSPPAP